MRPIGQERVFPPPRKIKRDFSADGVRKMYPKVTAQAEGKRICVGKRGRRPALFCWSSCQKDECNDVTAQAYFHVSRMDLRAFSSTAHPDLPSS
ncbi:hypothetical protein I7I50_05230 [Histoplasma capsulatum G186AR]|uniref:Uncharacterized protein n=1 Tax=Ajellomyces capsulatus TaxID=5037 RepID=A0A8H7Z6P2_AJECA|nr:hypothetical protein I7I52_03489 [Histoplasma capsulatum]QSS75931.1 hypothetical protein I7I50_05230 [Histoplasma capsulatum G186AR]